jgi:hypothetical protein
MISYLQAVDVIRTFAINHLQIQRFGFEFREQMPNIVTTEESFPYLFVVPVGSNSLQNVREIDFDVYCVDKYQSERNNVPYIISDTDLILADLTLWLEEGQDDIEVVRSYSITPINNDLLDYVGGHVMRLRVQVDRIALCEIPFDGDTPVPPVCPSGFVRNSDNTYTEIVLSGGTLVLPDITVTDSDGSTFTQPAVTNVVCTFNPPCEDAIVNINSVFFSNVPSGGTENIIVRQSTGSTQVGSIQGQYFRIADSTAVLKTTSNVTLSTTSIKAEDSEDIVAPDTSIEVNGVAEGSVVAGSTVDIQLSDSLGVVTPLSVTQTGNDFAVVLPDGGASLDTDAQAFIDAYGMTDSDTQLKVNSLVIALKNSGIWSKLYAFYPIMGLSASDNKWNLKDPRDLDAAFRLEFFGGISHEANGILGNGANAYANTHFNPSIHASVNSLSFGYACFVNVNNSNMTDMGCSDGTNLTKINPRSGGSFSVAVNETALVSGTNGDSRGVFSVNRTASNATSRMKISSVGANFYILTAGSTSSSAAPNQSMLILAENISGTPSLFSNRLLNCVYVSQGLTLAESVNIQSIINAFNIALNRPIT